MTLLVNQVLSGSLWIPLRNTHAVLYFGVHFLVFCSLVHVDMPIFTKRFVLLLNRHIDWQHNHEG